MHTTWNLLWWTHVTLAFVGLAAFWIPVLSPKGRPVHRLVGKVFMAAMLAVSISALAMATMSFLWPEAIHPTRSVIQARVVAGFLAYLSLATLVMVHNALAAVWWRDDKGAPWRMGLNVGLVVASMVMIGLAVQVHSPLLGAMSPIGFAAANGWRQFVRDNDKRAWLRAHLGATLTAGIAVHTAFIAGGGTRFLPEAVTSLGLWGWLLPTILGVPVIVRWSRKYAAPRP